ncbi:MAG: twin-arginine translocase subunit TatC [Thermoproteus sp.]
MSADREMSIWEHLAELAARLRRVLVVSVIVFLFTLMPTPQHFSDPLQILTGFFVTGNFTTFSYDIFYRYIIEPSLHMAYTNVMLISGDVFTPFNSLLYVSLYFTVLIVVPYLVYEIWAYIRPALYPHEIRAVRKYLIYGVLLFYLGNLYGLGLISRYFLRFLIDISSVLPGVTPVFNIGSVIDTIIQIALWSGVFFEAPIVVAVLSELCMLNPWELASYRPVIYAVSLIVIAIFTPDATLVSVFLTFLPFAVLLEVGLAASKRIVKKCPEYPYMRRR